MLNLIYLIPIAMLLNSLQQGLFVYLFFGIKELSDVASELLGQIMMIIKITV